MKTLPAEFRHRVIALTDDGMTTGEIAEALGTSATWVRSIKALHKSGVSLEPKSRANKRRSLADREGGRIRAQVAAKPGTTLEDLKRDLGLDTTIPNLWYALRDLKISLKKKRSTPPSGAAPTSPPTARPGPSSPPASTRADSSSSTRPSAPPP
jgi:transposase